MQQILIRAGKRRTAPLTLSFLQDCDMEQRNCGSLIIRRRDKHMRDLLLSGNLDMVGVSEERRKKRQKNAV